MLQYMETVSQGEERISEKRYRIIPADLHFTGEM